MKDADVIALMAGALAVLDLEREARASAAARLAEATELVRDALRYPHKPGSKHSIWDKRAFAFLRATDSASLTQESDNAD